MALLSVVVVVAFATGQSLACTCDAPSNWSFRDTVVHYDLIFRGYVASVEPYKLQPAGKDYTLDTSIIRFRAIYAWKGSPASEILLFSEAPAGSCGYEFGEGHEYIVFAKSSEWYRNAPELAVNVCSPTAPAGDKTRRLVRKLNRLQRKGKLDASDS